MIDLTSITVPDDSLILDTWLEDCGLACITAADELNIYDALSSKKLTAIELSEKLELGSAALDAICKVLVSYQLLEISNNSFSLTNTAKSYWVKSSPLYRGLHFTRKKELVMHKRVVQTAKDGWSPISDKDKSFTEMWEKGELTDEAAKRFTDVMNSIILAPSVSVARSGVFKGLKHVIDVGGGSGAFCAALTTHEQELKATVMDLPQVCEVAKTYIIQYGQSDRVEFSNTNFFLDEWPKHGDAFYFSNILHDWPIEKCKYLLEKTYEALPGNGKIFIHECLLNDDKVSPRMTTIFNLLMYMNHRAQQFTFKEMSELLIEAGFKSPKKVHEFSYYSLIEATK